MLVLAANSTESRAGPEYKGPGFGDWKIGLKNVAILLTVLIRPHLDQIAALQEAYCTNLLFTKGVWKSDLGQIFGVPGSKLRCVSFSFRLEFRVCEDSGTGRNQSFLPSCPRTRFNDWQLSRATIVIKSSFWYIPMPIPVRIPRVVAQIIPASIFILPPVGMLRSWSRPTPSSQCCPTTAATWSCSPITQYWLWRGFRCEHCKADTLQGAWVGRLHRDGHRSFRKNRIGTSSAKQMVYVFGSGFPVGHLVGIPCFQRALWAHGAMGPMGPSRPSRRPAARRRPAGGG